jgi:hypothetical protein
MPHNPLMRGSPYTPILGIERDSNSVLSTMEPSEKTSELLISLPPRLDAQLIKGISSQLSTIGSLV